VKDGIPQAECAEYPSHALRREVIFLKNELRNDAKIQAVNVGDPGYDCQNNDNPPAHASGY
jgi:hypothetical protein